MAQQTTTTLKTYFNKGDKPTEGHFADTLESFLNKVKPLTIDHNLFAKYRRNTSYHKHLYFYQMKKVFRICPYKEELNWILVDLNPGPIIVIERSHVTFLATTPNNRNSNQLLYYTINIILIYIIQK